MGLNQACLVVLHRDIDARRQLVCAGHDCLSVRIGQVRKLGCLPDRIHGRLLALLLIPEVDLVIACKARIKGRAPSV